MLQVNDVYKQRKHRNMLSMWWR